MSWMDSWSRPSKSQAVPAPFYLTHADTVKYCHTCGRVIGSRRSNTAKSSQAPVKYCSEKCKRHKPNSQPESTERKIEEAIVALLQGRSVKAPDVIILASSAAANTNTQPQLIKAKHQPKKGDPRIIVQLSEVEEAVFGARHDPEKVFGRKKNRRRRGVVDGPVWKSIDMEDKSSSRRSNGDTSDSGSNSDSGSDNENDMFETEGVRISIRPPQDRSEVNFSVGGERGWAEKIEETPEMQAKRIEGARRAEEKEMVKQAARRAVVFGVAVDPADNRKEEPQGQGHRSGKRGKKNTVDAEADTPKEDSGRRLCEALMQGAVVEPSFAKGDWSIRWRDD